jgi:hypothetical protein
VLKNESTLIRATQSLPANTSPAAHAGALTDADVWTDASKSAAAQSTATTEAVDSAAIASADFKAGVALLDRTDLFNLLCILPDARDGDVPDDVYQDAMAFCVKKRAMLIAAAVSQSLRQVHEEARHHDHLVSKRLQARKRGRELEVGAHALRQPFVVNDAVWMVDNAQASGRFRRRLHLRRERRNHGVEQRQCHGRAHPAKNRPARDRLSGHDHDPVLLIRNGALFTSARIVDDQR